MLFAAVVNDLHRAAGRSGVGAVMGSKNLKAIAVRGTQGVGNVKDAPAFMKAATAAKKVLADNAVTGQGLPKFGTQVLMNVINEMGALPTRNHRDVQFEKAGRISAEAMHEKRPTDGKANLVTNQACFGCTIACGRISKIDETHFTVVNKPEYWGASGGLEYEAAWALGAATGVGDLEALTYANFVCNEDGIDPISFGATVGAAMELYDLGLIKESDVGFPLTVRLRRGADQAHRDDLPRRRLRQGDRAGLEAPVRQARPAGAVDVGQGAGVPGLRLARHPGHGPRLRHVQPRRLPPARLHGRLGGARHSGQDRSARRPRARRGWSRRSRTRPRCSIRRGCASSRSFAWTLADVQPQLQAACEGDWSMEKLALVGERIWNLERQFNNAAGFTGKDDNLPKRLLTEAAKTGPAKGLVNGLDKMLPEYYELRGWSKDGVPTKETLSRLGLSA